jgi:hypothetical protein
MAKGPHSSDYIAVSATAKKRLGKHKVGAMTWDEALLEVLDLAERS